MRRTSVTRFLVALTAGIMLCGFTFTRHHITEAPVVDQSAPFFGTGLVIGPAEQLPGVVKRVPAKLRAYKWLLRKGNTQYVPGLRRELDCSLSELYIDLATYTAAQTIPRFQDRLRSASGQLGAWGSYPHGCTDPLLGIAGHTTAGGRLPNGNLYGAGPDFHQDAAIVVYRSDGQMLLNHFDISLAPNGTNHFIDNVAVGDFNNDGDPDYAVTVGAYGANASARIAILLGDGVGGYGAPTYYTLISATAGSGSPANASGFTIADFNGDGHLDIAVTAESGSTKNLVLLFGQGNGQFAAPVVVTSGVSGGVVSADFNGDGKLDLATGDGQLLFGDGHGGFTLVPGQRFDAGKLAVGDFNNDGNADLVIDPQPNNGSALYIWLGDGTGHFTRVEPGYATGYGSGTADLTVTDIDGDGNADVVVGSSGGGLYGASINGQGQTHFLLGRGDGTLASPPLWSNALTVVADFDHDGKSDLLALDNSTGTSGVRPLLGDGQGGFRPGAFSPLGFDFNNGTLEAWLAADLNGDGNADLIATQNTSSQPPSGIVHTRLGNGDGTFHASGTDVAVGFGLGSFGYGNGSLPALADFAGEGTLDLAVVGYPVSGSGLYLIRGNGDGTLQPPQTIDGGLTGSGDPPAIVAAADFNGDGKPDLVVTDSGRRYGSPPVAGSVRIYRNLGGGNFAAAVILPGPMYPEGLAIGDVNGDGRPDIVVTSESAAFANDTLYVFLGNGDGSFQAARTQDLPDYWYQSIAIGDADNDGKQDLVLGNCCGLTFARFARGDGTGAFAAPTILPLTVSPKGVMLTDLKRNGHLDLLVQGGDSTTPTVRTFLNTWKDSIFHNGFEPN